VEEGLDRARKDRWLHFANSRGIRSAELPLSKPAGTFRILFLGDSWTYGFGVDAEDAFPGLLARMLRERYPGLNVQTVNAGVLGYCMSQSISILKDTGLLYHPDLVVLVKARNELNEVLLSRYNAFPPAKWLRQALASSYLHMLLWRYLNGNPFRRQEHGQVGDVDPLIARDLREAVRTCRRAGVKLAFVYLDWNSGASPMNKVAKETGAPILHVILSRERHSFPRDPNHPNREGHRIAAEEILKFIEDQKLLPALK